MLSFCLAVNFSCFSGELYCCVKTPCSVKSISYQSSVYMAYQLSMVYKYLVRVLVGSLLLSENLCAAAHIFLVYKHKGIRKGRKNGCDE